MESKEVLEKMFEMVRELPPSKKYREKSRFFQLERDKFLKEIGESYKNKMEYLVDIHTDMNDELIKQAFLEGFSIAVKLFVNAMSME